MAKKIHVIVNPVSGPEPVPVDEMKRKLEESGAVHKVEETRPDVKPAELAKRAVEEGADLVIAAGGDGTVLQVAEGLVESGIPLGVIPEGTANVFATELGIPADSMQALEMLLEDGYEIRKVDVGVVGGQHFLLRVGIGLEAAMTVMTDPELKRRYGFWAYLWTVIEQSKRMKHTHYDLTMDGKNKTVKGITCVICNSGNLGLPGVQLAPEIDPSDGYLNVIVIKQAKLRTIGSLLYHAVEGMFSSEEINGERMCYTFYSSPAKEVVVTPWPSQIAARDGEKIESGFPLTVGIKHEALLVAVPKS